MVSPKKISDFKPILTNVAQTSHYQVFFDGLSPDLFTFLGQKNVDRRFITENSGLLCSSASIPGSALATSDIFGNFTGVQEKFAHKYYDEIGIGIDFTARDLQSTLKEKGLPWEKAKGFNGSAPISNFVSKENFDLTDLNFSLKQNGDLKQEGNSSLMLYSIDQIISYVSQFFTLKKGDILFTGTPEGVETIEVGDILEAFIEDKNMVSVEVK